MSDSLKSVAQMGLEPIERTYQVRVLTSYTTAQKNKRTKPRGVRNGREAAWPESNRQHPDPKSRTLPLSYEVTPVPQYRLLAGAAGLEPETFGFGDRRSSN